MLLVPAGPSEIKHCLFVPDGPSAIKHCLFVPDGPFAIKHCLFVPCGLSAIKQLIRRQYVIIVIVKNTLKNLFHLECKCK